MCDSVNGWYCESGMLIEKKIQYKLKNYSKCWLFFSFNAFNETLQSLFPMRSSKKTQFHGYIHCRSICTPASNQSCYKCHRYGQERIYMWEWTKEINRIESTGILDNRDYRSHRSFAWDIRCLWEESESRCPQYVNWGSSAFRIKYS